MKCETQRLEMRKSPEVIPHQKEDRFTHAASLFRQLGDKSTLKIFWVLCHERRSLDELIELTDQSDQTDQSKGVLSMRLNALLSSGLLECQEDGDTAFYQAADTRLTILLHEALENAMDITCPRSASKEDAVEAVKEVHDYISTHLDAKLTIDALAQMFHINTTTLKETFKKVYGTSLSAHMRKHRMEKAQSLLLNSTDSCEQIARAVGYQSQSRFSQVFKDAFGVLPTAYRKQKRT